jgi:hypothetical protein
LEDRQPIFQRTFGQDGRRATQRVFLSSLARGACRDVRPAAHGLLAGGGPAATHFLLRRQKKVSKEKVTPLSASRSRAAGNLSCGGLAGNRSNSAIASDNRGSISRQSPATQAHTEGEKRIQFVALCATLPSCERSSGSLRSNARHSRASSAVRNAVMRRRVAQGAAGKEAQMFEPAGRVSAPPAGSEQRSVPEAKRRVDESGSPSLCLLFLGEARESESPAGARPGLPIQPKSLQKTSTNTSPASATSGKPIRGSV